MCMADWLSQCRVTGVKFLILNSSSKRTSQVTSDAADAIDLYSASDEEREIVDCFLDFQTTGDWPSNITSNRFASIGASSPIRISESL